MGARGKPSRWEGSTKTSIAAYISGMSCRTPANTHAGCSPESRATSAVRRSALSASVPPTKRNARARETVEHDSGGRRSSQTPFSATRRPTKPTTGALFGDS